MVSGTYVTRDGSGAQDVRPETSIHWNEPSHEGKALLGAPLKGSLKQVL